MANTIFLDILGSIFKLNFKRSEQIPTLVLAKERLKSEIGYSFSDIIVNKKNKKIDFTIDFHDFEKPELIVEKQNKSNTQKFFHNVFTVTYGNKISCSSQIGIYYLRMLLWIQMLKIISKKNGFVIHSSASSIEGNANIFLGYSGAGKSTTANLLAKAHPVLADDSGIIMKEEGKYSFYTLPFVEKVSWVKRDATRYNIGKIFFIKKAKFFKIEKITNREVIMKKFVRQAIQDDDATLYMSTILDFVSNFDDFYYLYLYKDQDKLIDFFKQL